MNLPNEETIKNRIIFRVEDVTGMIGERMLWSHANFQVRGGDKLAIIGPNGSGKTTLVKRSSTKSQASWFLRLLKWAILAKI